MDNTTFRTTLYTVLSTLLAAFIGWSFTGLYAFVTSVYDLRDTVAERGKLLAQLENYVSEHHKIDRRIDAIEREDIQLKRELNEFKDFKSQGGRYTAEDGQRTNARIEKLEQQCETHREYVARRFGETEARLTILEKSKR